MKGRFFDILKEVEREHEQGTGSSKDSHLMIIDGLNTFIRVFSAVPALNDDGDHIGGVTGFLRSIAANIRQHKPTRCVIVFDGKGGSRRRKDLFPEYKANPIVCGSDVECYCEFSSAKLSIRSNKTVS